jgi:hypothetical protein
MIFLGTPLIEASKFWKIPVGSESVLFAVIVVKLVIAVLLYWYTTVEMVAMMTSMLLVYQRIWPTPES